MELPEAAFQTTSLTLLSRVRNTRDETAWRDFEDRYRELLLRFTRRRGLQLADAEDVVQTVFVNLAKALPGFVYDRARGRFRDYLYRCVRSAISAWARRRNSRPAALGIDEAGAGACDDKEGPSDEAAVWLDEWVAHHYRTALASVRETFDAKSVAIFEQNLAGVSVAELAAAHGMSEEAVYAARRRIRVRMQELVGQQVEDEDRIDDRFVKLAG